MGMILGINYGDLLYPNVALKILVGVFVILVGISVVLFLPERDPASLLFDTIAQEDEEYRGRARDLGGDLGGENRVESSTISATVVVNNEGFGATPEMTSNDSGVTSDVSVSDHSPSPVTPETVVRGQKGPQVHVVLEEVRNVESGVSSDEEEFGVGKERARKVGGLTGKKDDDANSLSSVPQTSDGEAF